MADPFLKALRRQLTGGTPMYALSPGLVFGALGGMLTGPVQVLVPAATMTPNAALNAWIQTTFAANTVAAFQIPTNIPTGFSWQFFITIINTSGGALTNITFVAAYKQAAFTFPATTKNRTYEFISDGTNAWEIGQTAADAGN